MKDGVSRIDSKERFSATVDDYQRYRPSYPPALVDWVIEHAGLEPRATVLDLGCGTGITTRVFQERGLRVIGIDPNAEMLASAREHSEGLWVRSACEAIGLTDNSARAAIAGQSFHWFDIPTTCAELDRLLEAGSLACAFWNSRVLHGLHIEYDRLLRAFSSEYAQLVSGKDTLQELREHLAQRDLLEAKFDNHQDLTREGLLGRARSSSYVAHGVSDLAGFERALSDLFAAHETDGHVRLEYETAAIAWPAGS